MKSQKGLKYMILVFFVAIMAMGAVSAVEDTANSDLEIMGANSNSEIATKLSEDTSEQVLMGSSPAVPDPKNINTGLSYATIQAAIDDPLTIDGHTIEIESGTYTENIILNKRLILKPAVGATVTIEAADIRLPIIDVVNDERGDGSGSIIQGLTIKDTYTDYRTMAGIRIQNADSVRIIDNIIIHNHYGLIVQNSDANIITGNTIKDQELYGIWILDGSICNKISKNTLLNNLEQILIVSSTGNEVVGNSITSGSGIGITLIEADGTKITDNIISQVAYGIHVAYSTSVRISNNNISNNIVLGILVHSDGITITGNIVNGNGYAITPSNKEFGGIIISSPYGADNDGSDNNIVSGNTICGNGFNGIAIFNSKGNLIIKNTITNNGFNPEAGRELQHGIYLLNSGSEESSNIISDNQITQNRNTGIWLERSNYNRISKNTIGENGIGIVLYSEAIENSDDNTFSDNTIYNNRRQGIDLFGDDNKVLRNTITGNGYEGVTIVGSNNKIMGNTISNNWIGIDIIQGDYSKNNEITKNTIRNNRGTGIWLGGVYGTKIIDNVIKDNGYSNNELRQQVGIYVIGSLDTEVSKNTITNNKYAGILIAGESTAEVHMNQINSNGKYGLENAGSGAVNAENNWWGTNADPTLGTDPQVVNTGTGTVDANPWKKKP